MSREIKIHLPEDQCDALAREAKAAGRSFFDHCRQKLLANMSVLMDVPLKAAEGSAYKAQTTVALPRAETDRIDRLEAMMMQMADAIQNLANPQHLVEAEPLADIDVNDVINQSLEAAERMPVEREEPAPRSSGVRPVGQRMVSRLAVGVPNHLQGHFPS